MLSYDGSDFLFIFRCFTFRCSEVTLTEIPSSHTLYFVHSKHNTSVFTLKPGDVTYPWEPSCTDARKVEKNCQLIFNKNIYDNFRFENVWDLQPILLSELTRVCSYPVGIQSGRIKNTQITASSMWNKYHAPYFGRLKRVRRGRYMGGWSARHNNHRQWIQVDLRQIIKFTMISTQGRKLAKQWVTRYTVSYSVDCVHFVPYNQRDRLKVWRRRIFYEVAEVTIKEHFFWSLTRITSSANKNFLKVVFKLHDTVNTRV